MATVRLTHEIRGNLVRRLLQHAFGEERASLEEDKKQFGDELYDYIYPKELQKTMEMVPNGFLPIVERIEVKFGTFYCSYKLSGKRRISYSSLNNCSRVYDDLNDPIAKKGLELWEREESLEKRRNNASRKAFGILNQVTTIKKLIEVWPEMEPFCEIYKSSDGGKLPAILPEEANEIFKLPVRKEKQQ